MDVPTVPLDSECDHCRQAGDTDPVASTRLSRLLALEIQPGWWPSQDRPRDPRPHPTDEQREPAVGSAADTRRIADARHRSRPINRGQVHDETARAALPGLEDIPKQSYRRHAFSGSFRSANNLVQAALRFVHLSARARTIDS